LRLVWSARFEHDKGGDRLYLLLRELRQRNLDFELAVTGQQFRDTPDIFAQIRRDFDTHLVHFGYLESGEDYRALLRGADILVSTALHEFQGLAVLEAVACGCLPVVPDRLVYPEIYPAPFRYASCPEDPGKEARGAAALVLQFATKLMKGAVQPPDVTAFDSGVLKSAYLQALCPAAG
jgi:glycosyltransferase involved in cell wall biosynthesis